MTSHPKFTPFKFQRDHTVLVIIKWVDVKKWWYFLVCQMDFLMELTRWNFPFPGHGHSRSFSSIALSLFQRSLPFTTLAFAVNTMESNHGPQFLQQQPNIPPTQPPTASPSNSASAAFEYSNFTMTSPCVIKTNWGHQMMSPSPSRPQQHQTRQPWLSHSNKTPSTKLPDSNDAGWWGEWAVRSISSRRWTDSGHRLHLQSNKTPLHCS